MKQGEQNTDGLAEIGRLVFRHEGKMCSAYLELTDNIDKPYLLGSIRIVALQSEERKRLFTELMVGFINDILKDCATGEVVLGEPRKSPAADEQSGKA